MNDLNTLRRGLSAKPQRAPNCEIVLDRAGNSRMRNPTAFRSKRARSISYGACLTFVVRFVTESDASLITVGRVQGPTLHVTERR